VTSIVERERKREEGGAGERGKFQNSLAISDFAE
jgi:hypothetical protein